MWAHVVADVAKAVGDIVTTCPGLPNIVGDVAIGLGDVVDDEGERRGNSLDMAMSLRA